MDMLVVILVIIGAVCLATFSIYMSVKTSGHKAPDTTGWVGDQTAAGHYYTGSNSETCHSSSDTASGGCSDGGGSE